MVANQRDKHATVTLIQTHPGGDLGHQGGAGDRVVAVTALADVVKQSPEEQEVWSGYPTSQGSGLDRRLDQVAVNGVAMQRIVLPPITHGLPLRNQPRHQAGLVERFEYDERRPARAKQRDER